MLLLILRKLILLKKQTIAPKQTVDFVVNISVPIKDFVGIVAGGITLRDVTEKKTANYINKVSIEASVTDTSGKKC